MSRSKKITICAILSFVGGFTVGEITNHHEKPCKVVWSQYTNSPGACAER